MTAVIVLIPALEPGPALPRLVHELLAADPDLDVWVVDDGSPADSGPVFEAARTAGATVLRHGRNLGKGAALKTGLAAIACAHPTDDVVTADADGQHTVADILRIVDGLREDAAREAPALILGCRGFTGRVPLRSRAGNTLARATFRLAAGWALSDTQTGLRGIPASVIAWMLSVPGERFEYEQNVLLRSRRAGIRARELRIETVYLDHNAGSHFRPVVDSARIAIPLLLFAASSLMAFVIDTVALLVFTAATGSLTLSIVAARVLSASVNFAVNRRVVFGRHGAGRTGQAVRYAVLALVLLASNVVWMQALTGYGVPLIMAKVATEAVLFVTSYGVQRGFVFGRGAELVTAPEARHRNPIASRTRMESDAFDFGRHP
ncbi:bifunctional glycosyltransferase family 2/GtrA family protein [Microbacterium sp. ARD31]|uniref:bifunctional glycosyltransferase family 2/GtrA family protein n=1 Tax=Microbacterium sp. ARD31 TaxID=2962576 RepID=UPI002882AF39|nr:bifunctional glycosyltransferase family 2/GtrA family protein [Microbacterium sp. ARD31]MDT0180193.1 bifunctional glycosyltransferase family 2/GtrA family protein [Microbacterium sp. ARD31]